MSDWCTIESDPGVFSSLIESFGVVNAQLTELYALDDDSLRLLTASYGKIHGLVFLFKWQGNNDASHNTNANTNANTNTNTNHDDGGGGAPARTPLAQEDIPQDLFFARQVVTNACATQALLGILLNAKSTDNHDGDDDQSTTTNNNTNDTLVLGDTLSALKSFTTSFPPDLKGEAIGASDEIRTVHNSFARKETFLMDDSNKRIATKDDDVFHFIAYVPHKNGTVYELDGLQPGPISVGTYDLPDEADGTASDDFPWLAVAREAIQMRIAEYESSEIKFNLMALTQDKRTFLQSKIKKMVEAAGSLFEDCEVRGQLQMELMQEEELRKQWMDENERRRHNYLPFCVELIKALAKSGNLQKCTKKAKDRAVAASRTRKMA